MKYQKNSKRKLNACNTLRPSHIQKHRFQYIIDIVKSRYKSLLLLMIDNPQEMINF